MTRSWTPEDVERVRELVAEGLTVAEIAERLERTPAALRALANRHRFSLRRPGTPLYGAVLGEPRGRVGPRDYTRARYRRAVAEGRIDPEALEQAAWSSARDAADDTCPVCGENPASVTQRTTLGPCRSCRRERMEANSRD